MPASRAAWVQLDELHQRNQPYNLIYSRKALFVVARVPQNSPRLSPACKSYGWSEMAGVFNLFNRERYDTLNAERLTAELASFALRSWPPYRALVFFG